LFGVFAIASLAQASAQSVSLSWNADSDPTVTGYRVYYGTAAGSYTQSVDVGNSTSAAVAGLNSSTTYYLAVAAYNGSGNQSGYSNEVSAIPTGSASSNAPVAPASLSAAAGNAQVALNWPASSGATSYNIKRSTTSGGGYATIATATGTSVTDSGVSNGTTYYYIVTAVNGSGESAGSPQASATPQAAAPAVPSTPSGLNASAGNGQVSLGWTASSGATSYNLKRSTVSGGPYTTIGSPASTSSVDSAVTNGTTYFYVISAVNTGGESANSSEVSAKPIAPIPAIPSGLSASGGNAMVSLSWTASSGATSYNIKRATNSGGPYTTLTTATSTYATDSSATNGTAYYYVVSALSSGGESGNSSEASATPNAPAPAPPAGLTASPGNAQVTLKWTASNGATSYNIKRSTTNGGPYATISTSTSASALDSAVTNGTAYYYVVTAVNASGESSNSAQVNATPSALPSPWVTVDVGSVGTGGAAGYANSVFSITGAGAGLGGTSDAFRYVYQPATGNGSIIAQVTGAQSSSSSGVTGLMIRDTTNANGVHAGIFVTPNNVVTYEWRSSTGGATSRATASGMQTPVWLKLTYGTNTCKGYYSRDGVNWTELSPKKSANMSASYTLGMVVSSGVAGTTATSTITSVTAVP
jgi:fibronectin type 3 domain-containing protein